ncbi:MAG: hypothetical protein QXI84_08150 [Thermofilaceae archaeon]
MEALRALRNLKPRNLKLKLKPSQLLPAAAAATAVAAALQLHPLLLPTLAAILLIYTALGYMHGLDQTLAPLALAPLLFATVALTATLFTLLEYQFYDTSTSIANAWIPSLTYAAAALTWYFAGYALARPIGAEPIPDMTEGEEKGGGGESRVGLEFKLPFKVVRKKRVSLL